MSEYFYGVEYADSRSHALMVCSDPMMSYEIVPEVLTKDEEVYEPLGSADPEVEYADIDRLDWSVVQDGSDLDELGIPLSWFAIKSRAEGEQWYREHTKMPESMIHYVGRYYWGDGLQPPKPKGHGRKKNKPAEKLQVNKGHFVVEF